MWRLPAAFRADYGVIYVKTTGTAGTTTVDIEKSTDGGASWRKITAGLPEDVELVVEVEPEEGGASA